MILKPISKLIMKSGCISVLYLGSSCNLNLNFESITKMRVFERHVEVWKKCDKDSSCIECCLNSFYNCMLILQKFGAKECNSRDCRESFSSMKG